MFKPCDAENILKLLALNDRRECKLMCCISKAKRFSVKSCYKYRIDRWSNSPSSSLSWKTWGELSLLTKLLFCWKIGCDNLPMMLNLLKRRIPILDPMCPLCGCEEETTLDLFYLYNIIRSTLFAVGQVQIGGWASVGRTLGKSLTKFIRLVRRVRTCPPSGHHFLKEFLSST